MTDFPDLDGSFMGDEGCKVLHAPFDWLGCTTTCTMAIAADMHGAQQSALS